MLSLKTVTSKDPATPQQHRHYLFWVSYGALLLVAAVIGGIIGVILVGAVLDWALVILSSLAGSALLVDALNPPQFIGILAFILLAAIGISIQARGLRHGKR